MNRRSKARLTEQEKFAIRREEREWLLEKLWLLWDGSPNGVPELLERAEGLYK